MVSTRQWAHFPFSLGHLLRRPVRTNVMSTVGQEVSEGVGVVDEGRGCGPSLQRQQLKTAQWLWVCGGLEELLKGSQSGG